MAPNFSRLNGSMFVFKPRSHFFPFASRFTALAAALLFVFSAQPGVAQTTHLWTQSRIDEFEKGTPQGVSVTSDGHLREGPGLTEVLTTPSTFVWSIASGNNGQTYVGTASPASVLRVDKDGKPFTLFETKDVSVQALRLQGEYLYAATLPSGKVYRLKADAATKQDESTATVIFDMGKMNEEMPAENKHDEKTGDGKQDADKADGKSHYIWDLTFDSTGRLYIATGDPGAVYRVNPSKPGAKPEAFFKSDEAHIRCVAWDGKGNLLAGSDGSGLIYRIDSDGKGYVLFEAPRREITSLAVGANGTIYAASVGDKSHNPLPPLPVQGQGSITITVVQQPGSLQAANASVSVPEGSEIYALTEGQAPRRLWAGKDEIVYALAAQKDGLLALTGNRGHIFKIADNGDYADIAHLDAQQGLSLASIPEDAGGILIGAGNTGKLVRLGAIEKHEYSSDVLDAGALARFGRIEVEPGSAGYELLTRSGNVEQPVRGWSGWQPLKDGAVASPAGRFFEWKAVLHQGGKLGSVGVNYLPVNAAPVVDDLVVVTGARINPQTLAQNQPGGVPPTVNIAFPTSNQNTITFDGTASSVSLQAVKDRTAVTVRWAAHDDNGDDLIYSLYLRGDGESVWRLLKDLITDKVYSFDSTLIPDGGYRIKVVASDSPSHTPADALTGDKVSDRFEVDTTPPVVSGLKATAEASPRVTFDAEDVFSPIAHAEYSLDAGPWQFIDPVGQLSDSKQEHYDFHLPAKPAENKPGEHLITVRVYDRHDNIGVAKAVFTVPAAKAGAR
ncbi:MAG: WD40 repeat domain-containing protein [Terracidiphilus sp.]